MRRRSERQQEFEAIKQNLFAAGVSTVKAAKTQEEMFSTTLEALTEAYEGMGADQLEAGEEAEEADLTAIIEGLLAQRQQAASNQDYEAYIEAEEKLQRLDELALNRLERQVRRLKAQRQIMELASKPQPSTDAEEWTETALKQEYKTLANVQETFGINARRWKDAVKQVNEQVQSV
jgi:hypothetical protein